MKAEDLSWQDIRRIVQIADEVIGDGGYKVLLDEEGYYEQVLKAFQDGKD